jgi:hypothetical protein
VGVERGMEVKNLWSKHIEVAKREEGEKKRKREYAYAVIVSQWCSCWSLSGKVGRRRRSDWRYGRWRVGDLLGCRVDFVSLFLLLRWNFFNECQLRV